MIIARKHIHILDVGAVLLFSLLANYVLTLHLDFRAPLDRLASVRLVALTVSAVLFYLTVDQLKEIASYAAAEFSAETSITERAARSIDHRYAAYLNREANRIYLKLAIALVSAVVFFVIEPSLALLNS